MQIKSISRGGISTVKNLKAQKGQTKRASLNAHQYNPSFGFFQMGIESIDSTSLRSFLNSSFYDKSHLAQIFNYRVNNIIEGDIKPKVKNGKDIINLYEFGSRIAEDLRLINKSDTLQVKDVLSALKETLETAPSEDENKSKGYVIHAKSKEKKEFIKVMIEKLEEMNPEDNLLDKFGYFGDFTEEVANEAYKRIKTDYNAYNESIRKKLEYSEREETEKFDVEEEFQKLPKEEQQRIIEEYGADQSEMCQNYLAERGSQDYIPFPKYKNFDTAIIQTLPRYNAQDTLRRQGEFEKEPVYRWLKVDNLDEFLKQFEIGGEYSYPKSQSCSKNSFCAENAFYDDMNQSCNVKLRIHPKNDETKAYDFKSIDCNRNFIYDDDQPRYRSGEVIYPADTKFRVLGVKKDMVRTSANTSGVGRYSIDTNRILIDLQEI